MISWRDGAGIGCVRGGADAKDLREGGGVHAGIGRKKRGDSDAEYRCGEGALRACSRCTPLGYKSTAL